MKHHLIFGFIFCLASCSPKQQNRPVVMTHQPVDTATTQPLVLRNEVMVTDPMTTDFPKTPAPADTLAIATEEGVYLLEPTWYHGDEIGKEWEKLPWYGLFKVSDTEYEVKATQISIHQVYDAIVDNEGEATGWEVKVHEKDTVPVFLVGGNISLTSRKTTGTYYEYHILKPDSTFLLDTHYQLKAFGSYRLYSEESDEKEIYNYGLEMISGGKSQKLFSNYRFIDDGPHVVWQGYLDEDQIPDLLIDCKQDYNERVLVLFLSTKAKEGKIVKPVAKIGSMGC